MIISDTFYNNSIKTWQRNGILAKSRLDYIFIPDEWQHRVSDKIVTTSLTKSDHSALITSVSLLEDTKIGKSFL